jgi:hypothetical protein
MDYILVDKKEKGACVLGLQGADGKVLNVFVQTNDIKKFRMRAWKEGYNKELGYPDHKLVFINDVKGEVKIVEEPFNFEEDTYNIQELMNEFVKLSKEKQAVILSRALDYMQQYNGRRKSYCIAMGMGYENPEGESDTWIKKD